MATGCFVKDFAAEWRVDARRFAVSHRAPVLVGVGVSGQLGAGGAATVMVQRALLQKAVATASLAGRVFPIQFRAVGRGALGAVIGRDKGNDVVIPEYSVSKRHCVIRKRGRTCWIHDLGSTNGTWVADHRLESTRGVRLECGVRVLLGRFAFDFLSPEGFHQRVAEEACRALCDQAAGQPMRHSG